MAPTKEVTISLSLKSLVVTTAASSCFFNHWVSTQLLPRLKPGDVLVLDNASYHRGGNLEALVSQKGCHVLFMSPYSPELNSIEKNWASIKKILRSSFSTSCSFIKNIKRALQKMNLFIV